MALRKQGLKVQRARLNPEEEPFALHSTAERANLNITATSKCNLRCCAEHEFSHLCEQEELLP
jgi:desulfoferrodoxin (superoxide reductase-like protein)